MTRIQELLAARGCRISYSSLHRWIRRRNWQRRQGGTVRMAEAAPREVAELDFGRLGLVQDPETGRRRTAWALIVVLGYSRHSFVWPTFSQKLEDVIAGLEAAWAFFGGIPRYLVIDNFPAAVAGADALHPSLTRGFLEYSQHRGFIADPARVRHPKDKPKVERGVQYVRERFFKGGDFDGLAHLREEAARCCRDVAGMRVHGTTRRRPLQVFQCEERQALAPWEGEPYEDHPLAYRQGPSRSPRGLPVRPLLGAVVPLSAGAAGGDRAGQQAGAHLPPGKAAQAPSPSASRRPLHRCRRLSGGADPLHPAGPGQDEARWAEYGPAVADFAQRLFDGPLPWAKVRQGHKLIRMGQRYTPERLDAACRRALDVDLIDVRRVERILVQALERSEAPEHPPPLPTGRFARSGTVFAQAKGGQS